MESIDKFYDFTISNPLDKSLKIYSDIPELNNSTINPNQNIRIVTSFSEEYKLYYKLINVNQQKQAIYVGMIDKDW